MIVNFNKRIAIFAILMFILVFGIVSNGYSSLKEPPTGTERLTGPAIVATVSASYNSLTNEVTAVISGYCKGEDVILSSTFLVLGGFNTVTAADIEDMRIPGAQLACNGYVPVDLIINTVSKFTNTGTMITADVILLGVVLK